MEHATVRTPRTTTNAAAHVPGVGVAQMLCPSVYLLGICLLFACLLFALSDPGDRGDPMMRVLLSVCAVALLPMGLLAMVLHESLSVLNPVFLLGSIRRVLLPYAALVLTVATFVLLCVFMPRILENSRASIAARAGGFAAFTYGTLVLAHLLGRFYWRYRERLDWTV